MADSNPWAHIPLYPVNVPAPPVVDLEHRLLHGSVVEMLASHLFAWAALEDLRDTPYKLIRQNELLMFISRDLTDTFHFNGNGATPPSQHALQVPYISLDMTVHH
jgi:hypothetical protein